MNWGGSHGTNNPNPRLNGTVNALVTVETRSAARGMVGGASIAGSGAGASAAAACLQILERLPRQAD